MPRIMSVLLVLLLGVGCLSAQVAVPTSTSSPTGSAAAPDLSKITVPTVGFCELVSDPEKYDSQIVRTEAVIYYGFEASVLYLPGCDKFDTWASYDAAYDGKSKEGKRLYRMLTKGKSGEYTSAYAVLVGRFDGKKQVAFKLKEKVYYMGYGHMNIFDYQFTIMRVELAKKTPADAKR
jgi:hypothetical protein